MYLLRTGSEVVIVVMNSRSESVTVFLTAIKQIVQRMLYPQRESGKPSQAETVGNKERLVIALDQCVNLGSVDGCLPVVWFPKRNPFKIHGMQWHTFSNNRAVSIYSRYQGES